MTDEAPKPAFELEKIYLKDVSFESPVTPDIFMEKDYRPEINIDLNIDYQPMDAEKGYYEVVLNLEAKAVLADRTAFLVEVRQAGVFRIRHFTEEQMSVMLEVAAPNALLPFAREAVADLVTRGGFPQLLIQPVNFEALLRNRIKQQQAEASV
jgi:preprotein translocase subunit SecB